jgi:exodeoxyribonuclease VII small subunit
MTRYRGKVTTKPPPIDGLSYEVCRDELIAIVSKLEAGAATLDESMALWERGEALAKRCEQLLDGAQQTIEAATSGGDA